MSIRISSRWWSAARHREAPVALLVATLMLFFASQAHAQPGNLKFFRNYFVNGGYAAAGVNLRTTGVNGLAHGKITVTMPANVNVLAAFLYWQTVVTQNQGSTTAGAKIHGVDGSGNPKDFDVSAFAFDLNPAGTAPCWSSGGGTGASGGAHRSHTLRLDVLRFLHPQQLPIAAPTNTVATLDFELPDAGGGNQVPSTAGASLVTIYRSNDPSAPLTSVVIYDGAWTMDNATGQMTQTMQGFYQASSANPVAQMTHIVADGSAAKSEVLLFGSGAGPLTVQSNQLGPANPFQGADPTVTGGVAADPAWDTRTFLFPVAGSGSQAKVDGNTDKVTTTVTHVGTPFDCLSWGAIVFSTTVQDTDKDGLLDVWESQPTSGTLTDPFGRLLPDLYAMGARPDHKNLLVEIGAMHADSGTAYGTGAAQVVDSNGHNHLPTPIVLKNVGDAFKNSGISNPECITNPIDACKGIKVLFDVGPGYHSVGTAYAGTEANEYLVPAGYARGGETIKEVACVPDTQTTPRWHCQFPNYPGTVTYKFGYEVVRNALVADDGTEVDCTAEGTTCTRRRFDPERKDMFHYVLYAHSRGVPKEPCRNADGTPDTTCQQTNANFHVPTSRSGVADLPGGDVLVTLGSWGGFVGSDLVQASTTMHELGHNLWRGHSGDPVAPFEFNCNPNYLSIMNYLFQIQGVTNNGFPKIDFSNQVLDPLSENSLSEAALTPGPTTYWSSWYAPRNGVHSSLTTTAAQRHCDGSPLSTTEQNDIAGGGGLVKVNGTSTTGPIDWNGDLALTAGTLSQDITFNGVINPGSTDPTKKLKGAEDWSVIANIGLQQLGTRRNYAAFSQGVGDFSGGVGDFSGGVGDFSGGVGDFSGGEGVGDFSGGVGDFSGGVGDFSGGVGDFSGGVGDFSGGIGDFSGGVGQELTFEAATAVPNPPHSLSGQPVPGKTLTVLLTWKAPAVGTVLTYQVYRVEGTGVTAVNFAKKVLLGQPSGLAADGTPLKDLSFSDPKPKARTAYTYFVTATYQTADQGRSGMSNPAFVTTP